MVEHKSEISVVNHPSHYNSLGASCVSCHRPIECIDVVRHMDFTIGSAVKYLWRAGRKGDALTDLRKARWLIDHAIYCREQEEGHKEGQGG